MVKFPDEVRCWLQRHFKNHHKQWLLMQDSNQSTNYQWPLLISLSIPSAQKAKQQLTGVRAWITAWQAWEGGGKVIWCQRNWGTLGQQKLPEKLLLQQPLDVALCIGESVRWQRAIQRFQQMISLWPRISATLANYFTILADYDDINFSRLINMLDWIINNPNANLYLRQLPIAGIDSKWLEQRKTCIHDLVGAIQLHPISDHDFYQRCNLKSLPQLIRMRILDKSMSNYLGGLTDLSAPVEQLAVLNIRPKNVLIIENLQTGLAFIDMPDTVIFMGLGYHVKVLAGIPWISGARIFYWGDLDTHGFAILNQARNYWPDICSLLMDEKTLQAHQTLWVDENQPHAAASLSLLTPSEQAVYHGIKQHQWGQNIRLEQERIDWEFAMGEIKEVVMKGYVI